jgi:RNA polymerase sigma factor (sigma-70 family)
MDSKKQSDDKTLWLAFVAGEMDVYAQIDTLYAKNMYAYGLHFVSECEMVEDAIHDVFIKMYSNRTKLSSVRNIRLYLFVSLKNTLLNAFSSRKETFQLDLIDPLLAKTDNNAEKQLIKKEQSERVQQFIAKLETILTARQKQALYLKYVEQTSYKDIAQILEIQPQSAKNIIQDTLKKIRKEFPEIPAIMLSALLFIQTTFFSK